MKAALKILLLAAVAGYLVFAVAELARPAESVTCEALDIVVDDSAATGLIGRDYVSAILSAHKVWPEGRSFSDIDMRGAERLLEADPYVESAECRRTAGGRLSLTVRPRRPVLHVMSDDGQDYYLASNGRAIPPDRLNADLCVATGRVSRAFARDSLLPLAAHIQGDEFWNEQIVQIHVAGPRDIELYPRVGDHVILLGGASGYAEKLRRMLVFYRQGLPKVGWNKYKTISLAYEGQVVCRRKTTK